MTLSEAKQIVLDKLGVPFDDARGAHVRASLLDMRVLLLRREYEKTKVFSDNYISRINCFKIEQTSDNKCCEFDCGCPVSKSVDKLPELIVVKDDIRTVIKYVGSSDLHNPFGYIGFAEIPYFSHSKFTGKLPYWTIIGQSVYTFNSPAKEISIAGIFLDPSKINDCCTCDKNCFDEDNDFFIEGHLSQIMIDMVMNGIRSAKSEEIRVNE